MCRRVTCKNCNKPDWRGCGAHIDHVLGDVPTDKRCQCRQDPSAPKTGLLAWITGKSR